MAFTSIDQKLLNLDHSIRDLIITKNLINADTKSLRKLAKRLKTAAAEVDEYVIIRLEQKIGGHIGGTTKSGRNVNRSKHK